ATGRCHTALASLAPQVLLLQEGVNDLTGGDPGAISPMVGALRAMVADARGRGIPVFLGTLLPERPGGLRTGARLLIQPSNHQIRALAASSGAILVDLCAAFGGSPDPWIADDGLHPNDAGYRRIAEPYQDAISSRLEAPPTSITAWWRRPR